MSLSEPRISSLIVLASVVACNSGSASDDTSTSGVPPTPMTSDGTTEAATMSSGDVADSTTSGSTDDSGPLTDSSDDGLDPCLFCDAPNQVCIDDECVTTCQGQQPDPCGPAEVCDVMSGECRAPDAACTLSGDIVACGDRMCGPGTVCDGDSTCIAIAPCADVVCLGDGNCWGSLCSCERQVDCTPPDEVDLNGYFDTEISDLEFADDCTAWMVTLRSGTDFLRRLESDGTVTEWAGVANLNMGEVKVLKSVTPPAGIVAGRPEHRAATPSADAAGSVGRLTTAATPGVEGLGEVAITYTCCATCGCFVEPPQGVARLVEEKPANPLPIVIEAVVTGGTGPFGTASADAGPFGLTWGIDRVLYVGNSTANGDIVTADLDMRTQAALGSLPARITAGASISAAHLLFAVEGGDVYRFNVQTQTSTLVTSVGADVTSLSLDAFDGTVYAGLRTLEVIALDPWAGTITPFETMPGTGRVTVSPNGQLWFSPVAVIAANPIAPWDLPDTF